MIFCPEEVYFFTSGKLYLIISDDTRIKTKKPFLKKKRLFDQQEII